MINAKYPLAMRTMHWISGLMIMTLLAIGFFMADIPDDATNKYDLYPYHKAFGMIVLCMVLIRLPLRFKGPLPAPADGLTVWEQYLSHWVHILLYIAMFAMTFSGYFMSSTFEHAHGISMFGLFTVPDITSKSEYWSGIFHTIHHYGAWSFVALLGLHIAGVIKHRFIDAEGNDVLKRMI